MSKEIQRIVEQSRPRAFNALRYQLMQFNKLDPVDQAWELRFLLLLFVTVGLIGLICRFWL